MQDINNNPFSELGLFEPIVNAISRLGFIKPTEIQKQAIPFLLTGTKDLIGLAQTGTGKTAAFGLPLLQLINVKNKLPQALIVCPTRELCVQIQKDLVNYSAHYLDLYIQAVYGGAHIVSQIKSIQKGCDLVVATPGRLIDLIQRQAIDLQKIKYVVLDEADEMLNMGFEEDIEFILKNTPERNSLWLFSATMPKEIRQVIKKYMNQPVEVRVGQLNTANPSIEHQYFITNHSIRYEALKRLIDFIPGMYGLVFTRTKIETQEIAEKLTREGYNVESLHGDLSQAQRDKVMKQFRLKQLDLLIATDVAARGLDIQDISHVINYELPDELEVYTHRCGRTGRAGKKGFCFSLVTPRELYKLKQIERQNKILFHKTDLPTGNEVCRKQFFYFIDKFLSTDTSVQDFKTFLPLIIEKCYNFSKEEIIKKLMTVEFHRFLKYYENAPDLNGIAPPKNTKKSININNELEKSNHKKSLAKFPKPSNEKKSYNFTSTISNSPNQSLFINLGYKDGFNKQELIKYLLQMSQLPGNALGQITMFDIHSFVEIENKFVKKIISAIDGKNFKGRKLRINESKNYTTKN